MNKLVVIGGGTMGGGIAMSAANNGLPVTIVETSEEALQKGLKRCEANWQRSVSSGRMTQAEVREAPRAADRQHRFRKARGQADLVIEAVFENMAVKKEIFARLDKAARPGVVLASNTSTLDIDEIASATKRPELVIGMHFFSPANVMRLLENRAGRGRPARRPSPPRPRSASGSASCRCWSAIATASSATA